VTRTHVARYRLSGPMAGVVVILKQIMGAHLWRIVFHIDLTTGERETNTVNIDAPIPLMALQGTCARIIDEMFKGRDVVATSAGWDVYLVKTKGAKA